MVAYTSLIRPAVLILVPLAIGISARYFNFLETAFDFTYKLVVLLILPILVFGAVAVERPPGILSFGAIPAIAIIGLGVTSVVAVAVSRIANLSKEKSTEIFINASFMNYTFLGLAVVQSIVGTDGVARASVFAVTVGVIHLTIGIALTKSSAGKNVSASEILHDILSFPAVFALIVALLFVGFEAGTPYWEMARAGMSKYANVASFIMVLVAGYKMRIPRLKKFLSPVLSVGFIRLLIGPLVTFAAIEILGISRNISQVLLLMSVMPPGTFNIILAERFDLDLEAYGSIIFYLTLVSLFVAVPLVLYLTPQFSI